MDRAAIVELAEGIQEILGEKIVKIILYGSVDRGTDTEESDVDVALLMIEKIDRKTKDILSDFIVDMNLKYNRVFSVLDIDYEKFQERQQVLPFYRNINQEGIILWKAK